MILYNLKTLILSLIMLTTVSSCHAQKTYLVFGNGGGFTGQVTAFRLLKNGKVLKGSGRTDIIYTEYAKLKRAEAKKFFFELNDLKFVSFSEPGNMYYFIRYSHKKITLNYTWGATGFETPGQLKDIYRRLMSDVTELNFRQIK